MKYFKISFLLSATLFAISCNTLTPCGISKEDFLTNFTTFVDNIEEEKKSISDEDWESFDREYEQMVSECYEKYESDLTTAEKVDFWSDGIRYVYLRYGISIVRELNNPETTEEIIKVVQEAIEENKAILGEAIEDVIEELTENNDIKSFFNDLKKEIKDFGEYLEEELEELDGKEIEINIK